MTHLLIGDVAQRAGVSAPAIRYYESLGLVTPAHRTTAGYRRYDDTTVDALLFIRKAQALGFSLEEIGEVLALTRAGQTPCSRVLSLARQHLAAVDERIRRLQHFRDLLGAELSKWESQDVTCDGLCQFITDVDAAVVPPATDALARKRQRPTSRLGRSAGA